MRLPRTSIAWLMGFIVILAVAFAALARPTLLWGAFTFSGMLLALTFASPAALFTKGTRRAFWTGFLVGGSSYLFLQYGPFCEEHVGPYTLPTAVLQLAYVALHDEQRTIDVPVPMYQATIPAGASPRILVPSSGPETADLVAPPPPVEAELAALQANQPKLSALAVDTPFDIPVVQGTSRFNDAWLTWTAIDQSASPPIAASPSFDRIGNSFLSLIMAIAFGLVARRLAERSARVEPARQPQPDPPAALAD